MLWKLMQISIFAAVVISNGYWHWTPNNYVAMIVGVLAAGIATLLIIWLKDLPQTFRTSARLTRTVFGIWGLFVFLFSLYLLFAHPNSVAMQIGDAIVFIVFGLILYLVPIYLWHWTLSPLIHKWKN